MSKRPQYGPIAILLLTLVLLFSACGSREQNGPAGGSSSATPSSSPKGSLTGFVMTGPTCPGPVVTDGPTCPDTPVIHQQVQVMASDGHVITTVMTDQKGHFTITLAPGHYLLRANTSRVALHGTSSITPATILADHTTSLHITVDTGIR